MYDLYLLYDYNNYYNRILKKESDVYQYVAKSAYHTIIRDATNFNPGDGVNTRQVITLANAITTTEPNYMLVVQDDVILQRWFVIDCERTRGSQCFATLHRDVIAETWDEIKTAPIFVEKAILKPTDMAIFNRENMTYSEIKKKADELLFDRTGIPWIVGYGDFSKLDSQSGRIDFGTTEGTITPNIVVNGIQNYEFYNAPMVSTYDFVQATLFTVNTATQETVYYMWNNSATQAVESETTDQTMYNKYLGRTYTNQYGAEDVAELITQNNALSRNWSDLKPALDTAISNLVPGGHATRNRYFAEDGKIIKDALTNKYYRAVFTTTTTQSTGNPSNTLFDIMKGVSRGVAGLGGTPTNYGWSLTLASDNAVLVLNEITKVSSHVDVSNMPELQDAPYSMWFMPYGTFRAKLGGTTFEQNAQTSLDLATSIGQHLSGAGVTTDIQIVPYCPVQDYTNIIKHDGRGRYIDLTKIAYREIKNVQDQTINIMYVANTSQGAVEIPVTLDYYDNQKKVDYETTKYRLCSPGYNSAFEFSAQMNGGVDYIDVHFTYKPYNPYIHVAPRFNTGSMYGLNQPGDQRGLICSGNFSITQMTDVWSTYELNNINYQNAFDREIEHIEFQNRYAKINDILGVGAGVIGAAGTGAAIGSAGGPIAAAVSGAVAGTLSLAAGLGDVHINEQLRNEALNLKKDMFGYELGNIKARPNTIGKLTGFNNLSRFVPYLEFYESTEEEKQALKNKIIYNGMTVMRIGTISEFLGNKFYKTAGSTAEPLNYFKGQLIRAEISGENFHLTNAVAAELVQGIYIPVGGV